MKHAMKVLTLTLIVPVFLLAGCGKKDPVAGLNELPAQSAAHLKLVPDLHVLATRIEPPTVHPPEPFSTATLCGKDWTYTFFDAKITTPIALCTRPEARLANENNLLFPRGSGRTTFKLTDPRIFADLEDSVLEQPPLVCTVNNGPWSAQIVQERACIGTCSPKNTLTVVGVPNSVLFVWYGAFNDHPPGFEFVGLPVQIGESSDPCQPTPSPSPVGESGSTGAEQLAR
jgi:hypothetical protein